MPGFPFVLRSLGFVFLPVARESWRCSWIHRTFTTGRSPQTEKDGEPLDQCPGSCDLSEGLVKEVTMYLSEVMLDIQNFD